MAVTKVPSSLRSRMLAVAALQMGFSMISSAFGFYYVKIFLNFYHIQESWFQLAQTLFMVWNAINDPLFAYLQDSTNFSFTRTRRESILYAAPLFAISFLVPWFPWGNVETMAPWVTGIHLITALCFWDTMFTYVGLANCCLYTEVSHNNNERLQVLMYGKIGCLLGSSSVFFLQYISNQLENFKRFQITCVVVAVISCLLMRYCGKYGHTEQDIQNASKLCKGEAVPEKSQKYSYIALTKQILFQRDFLAFVVMNFFQEFHRTFVSNFLAIFCDQLIPKGSIPGIVRSVFYGGSSMAVSFLTTLGLPCVNKFGYFNLIRGCHIWKMCSGLLYFLTGQVSAWFLMVFLFCDIFASDVIVSLMNLPLSDIADSDTIRYNRRHRATSMVYGTNALVVKPAISLAPMVVVAILNRYGYEKFRELSHSDLGILNDVMFSIICLVPILVGVVQFCSWSFYTIRHRKNIDITLLIPEESMI